MIFLPGGNGDPDEEDDSNVYYIGIDCPLFCSPPKGLILNSYFYF